MHVVSNVIGKISEHADVRFSDNPRDVDLSANASVQHEYNMNLYAEDQRRALELVKDGKKDQAVQVMQQSSLRLRKAAEELNDKVLLTNSLKANLSAEEAGSALSSDRIKEMNIESYRTINQQQK